MFQADLTMDFGASGSTGMGDQLQNVAKDAPEDITPEATFEEPVGGQA